MKQITKISCIILAVLLLISTAACKQAPPDITQQKPSDVTQQKPKDPLEGVITTEEYNEIKSYIYGVLDEIELDLLAYSGYVYFFKREESDKLSEIGYKGLPVLITEIEKNVESGQVNVYCQFLASSVYALLRVDELAIMRDEDNGEYDRCTKKVFCLLYSNAKNQIPKILKEKISTEEKIIKLREFGILAVPYILDAIETGHTEYETFFTAIGLHMDIPEYMNYMSDRDSLWEHGFEKEGFMDDAEEFDYKAWLSENEEDLDNLFKYLDAYCAEYEAEYN